MSFEFIETVTIEFPKINKESFNNDFLESDITTGSKRLITEIAAIHAGLTSNFNFYSAEELEKSIKTWVEPYPKPIIVNHDLHNEPMGRVMAAKMDLEKDKESSDDGTPFIRLQIAVLDPIAVEKVIDGRYITGSVGGKANAALCSICGANWAKESATMPCKHRRGQVYNGKICQFDLKDISWKEYSFVNQPADAESGVRPSTDSLDDSWVRSAKIFSINMSEEIIYELNESAEPINILKDMKKKDAHFMYMNLKGTFLTTTAADFSEKIESNLTFNQLDTTIDKEQDADASKDSYTKESSEEKEMPELNNEQDILSVSEKLTADLLTSVEKEPSDNESLTEAGVSSENSDIKTDPEESNDETKEDAENSEATEPLSESDEDKEENTSNESTDESVSEESEERVESQEESEKEKEEKNLDLKEELIASLQEENAKLKNSLHFMLAERVVNLKINLGLIDSSEKADALKEHIERTPSSLYDAIKDLEKMPSVSKFSVSTEKAPKLEVKTHSVTTESESVIEEKEEDNVQVTKEISPQKKLEEILFRRLNIK